MNAFDVGANLASILPGLQCQPVNRRWLRVTDTATAFYLDCVAVGPGRLRRLVVDRYDPEARANAWSEFCSSTAAQHLQDLPINARRAAVAKFGKDGARTWGW